MLENVDLITAKRMNTGFLSFSRRSYSQYNFSLGDVGSSASSTCGDRYIDLDILDQDEMQLGNGDLAVVPGGNHTLDNQLTRINDEQGNISSACRYSPEPPEADFLFNADHLLEDPIGHEFDLATFINNPDIPVSVPVENLYTDPVSIPLQENPSSSDETEVFYKSSIIPVSTPVLTKPRMGGKKIDIVAQKYIVDEEEIDVENTEEQDVAILEAPDGFGLLQQFEQSQGQFFDTMDFDNYALHKSDFPEKFSLASYIFGTTENIMESVETEKRMNVVAKEIQPQLYSTNDYKTAVLDNPHPLNQIKVELEESKSPTYGEEKSDLHRNHEIPTEYLENKKVSKRRSQKNITMQNKTKDEEQKFLNYASINTKSKKKHRSSNRVSRRDVKTRKESKVAEKRLKNLMCYNVDTEPKISQNLSSFVDADKTTLESTVQSQNDLRKLTEIEVDLRQPVNVSQKNSKCVSNGDSVITSKIKEIKSNLDNDKMGNRAELLAKINKSTNRKQTKLISPLPTKKRGNVRSSGAAVGLPKNRLSFALNAIERINHDHSYSTTSDLLEQNKDSGFHSAEEDDQTVFTQQPTTLNANGQLMVSLLKSNTIPINNPKKKLKLEDYKKLRLVTTNTSQSSSPVSSTCSSPVPEDENLKLLKHQEKLKKMAADLLKTQAKSAIQNGIPKKELASTIPMAKQIAVPRKVAPPPDFEVKTFVSVAINTIITKIQSNKKIMASSEELEKIKPLLEKVSNKINNQSLITSVIENIPKVIKSIDPSQIPSIIAEGVQEDKVISYFKKDRVLAKTVAVGIQTDFDDIEDIFKNSFDGSDSPTSSAYGSVISSDSNKYSRAPHRSRKRRLSSHSSSNSSSCSSRFSRSRTSSSSPEHPPKRHHFDDERLREVDERRVVYVGQIIKGTSKRDLRKRFQRFGRISNISLHRREHGGEYGFVTFVNKEDAYQAKEHGNDGNVFPKYELSFGGRRIFCQTTYSDLDDMRDADYGYSTRLPDDSFDALLQKAKKTILHRNS